MNEFAITGHLFLDCLDVKNPRKNILDRLKKLLPNGELIFDLQICRENSGDKWFATSLPEAVAFPRSTKSVSTILKFANQHKIPVTARGAGFGYVGGCVPVRGGIVLSFGRRSAELVAEHTVTLSGEQRPVGFARALHPSWS